MNQRLQDYYPEKYVEVVNLAITAINSYTFYDQIDQVLKQQPDAILIYAGHNEFYGAMGISSAEGISRFRTFKIIHLKLLNLKTYQLVRNIITHIGKSALKQNRQKGATLMESLAQIEPVAYQDGLYKAAHKHFQKNMEAVLKKANGKNVHVFISELVSNTRDIEPFASVESNLHPMADTIYNMAKQLELAGDYANAKTFYDQAKDLDGIRFRASEELNKIISDLAKEHDASLVPMKTIFENNSPNRLIGNALLTEHVHPNIEGYFLMADAFFQAIVSHQNFANPAITNSLPAQYYRENWGFTALDSAFAALRVKQLMSRWPFVESNSSSTFLDSYQPGNKIDSLACRILKQEISMMDACKEMSTYHESHSAYYLAHEYMLSIARTNPHNPAYFMKAGDLLLANNQPDKALYMYLQSLKHTRQLNQLYKIGETYLKIGNKEDAQKYLLEALPLTTGSIKEHVSQLLSAINNQRESVHQNDDAKNQDQKVVVFAPEEVTELINQARQYLRVQNFEKVLELLLKANSIQETPPANRFIGEILLHHGNNDALKYLKKALPDHRTNAMFISTICYAGIVFGETGLATEMLHQLKQIDPENERIDFLEKELKSKGKIQKH